MCFKQESIIIKLAYPECLERNGYDGANVEVEAGRAIRGCSLNAGETLHQD